MYILIKKQTPPSTSSGSRKPTSLGSRKPTSSGSGEKTAAEPVKAVEIKKIMKGYTYILKCANGKYYTGSTVDLERRLAQHQAGEGANFTRKNLPVKLVYYEEFQRIDQAFYREKQIQGWSRAKKEALINGEFDKLPGLSRNYTQYGKR